MNETIVAIATASGTGSVAIVRLSGKMAYLIALNITKKSALSPRYAHLSTLYDKNDEPIDESIVIYFKGPKSYTAEDSVEFQCHGGVIVAQKIVETLMSYGARLANPGEFTKRAYLNGRIDLSEAEAIGQLIDAKSEDAARILVKQLKGSLKIFVESIREKLTSLIAYSEVSIDYAEEDLPQSMIESMLLKIKSVEAELRETLVASENRRVLMEGFRVAIIGKPNVGKSSLLNSILSYNRAIVSEIAGTTRDTVEEQIRVGSHLVRVVDTAGIRSASDEIERIGVERSIAAIEEADIVLAVFDGSAVLESEDREIFELINRYSREKSFIILLNKSDLKEKIDTEMFKEFSVKKISAKEANSSLIDSLREIMDRENGTEENMLISIRQIDAVKESLHALEDAKEPLLNSELEFFSFHLNEAIEAISKISRPFEIDEMFDEMFGSFCLGK